MTKRQEQALKTRKKILRCALDLFEEKGYDNVSMQEVARKSETSIGSIYHYFKSKEEMAAQSMEPLDDVYGSFFEELMSSEEYQGLKAVEKLQTYYIYVHRTLSMYENLRSLYIYSLKYPENKILTMSDNRELYRNYQILLKQCREEDAFRDGISDEEILDLLFQSSRGMIVDWLIRGMDFDFEAQARRWCTLILDAVRKK